MLPQAAAKYNEYYVQALVASLSDKQPEVRQAAAYGAGVMAMCGQNAFTETLKGEFRSQVWSTQQ